MKKMNSINRNLFQIGTLRLPATMLVVFVWCLWLAAVVGAQSESADDGKADDEMKVATQVSKLQLQLEDASLKRREAAERELVDLGVLVLDYLDPVTSDTSTETVERLGRIRKALESQVVEAVTKPKLISLKGEFAIKEAAEQLSAKSGNKLVWPDGFESALEGRTVELDIENKPFWEAMDLFGSKTDLKVNSFNSDQGELMLVPVEKGATEVPTDSSGIFQASVIQVSASRNLETPALNYCGLRVRLRWEPRLSPITLSIAAKSVKVVDEFDDEIKLPNPDANFSASVQPEIPEVEFSIPIGLVDRQIEKINRLEATLNAVLPGRSESFEFRKIGRLKPGFRQAKAGVSVSFEGIEKNEELYGVTVKYSFEESGDALESHLGWVYENPLKLVGKDGTEYEPLAKESAGRDENSVGIRYYFSDDPAAMTLRCETPAAIVSTQVKIVLTDIPLP